MSEEISEEIIEEIIEEMIEEMSEEKVPIVKPKRKYVRKVVAPVVPNVIVLDELEESTAVIPDLEKASREYVNIGDYTLRGPKTKGIYIYYEGSSQIAAQYIKDFQDLLKEKFIDSQIMIIGKPEYLKMSNCFYSEEVPKIDWHTFCTYRDPTICVRIQDIPKYDAKELFKLIQKMDKQHFDDFIEVKII